MREWGTQQEMQVDEEEVRKSPPTLPSSHQVNFTQSLEKSQEVKWGLGTVPSVEVLDFLTLAAPVAAPRLLLFEAWAAPAHLVTGWEWAAGGKRDPSRLGNRSPTHLHDVGGIESRSERSASPKDQRTSPHLLYLSAPTERHKEGAANPCWGERGGEEGEEGGEKESKQAGQGLRWRAGGGVDGWRERKEARALRVNAGRARARSCDIGGSAPKILMMQKQKFGGKCEAAPRGDSMGGQRGGEGKRRAEEMEGE
ncbi:unnamed protein product [Pleuronectes platessa]|uniref:Uncharacterized protein n=1 Tax=Pleuronectes platessa TaxID=8262 RepID=A0A9N7Z288_PLEPL|nr:unnamed protein product [Pleuronectes platessa]